VRCGEQQEERKMSVFRRKPNQKGFTMIELMVVVVIVAILAAIAIPIYGRYIKNARMTEAEARIGEIITAAKAYAQETDEVPPGGNGIGEWPPAGGAGLCDLNPTQYFTYEIAPGGNEANTALVITATGFDKMATALLEITVPNINSNGTITNKVLPN
jgi:type IV pilus assembly protein PilE